MHITSDCFQENSTGHLGCNHPEIKAEGQPHFKSVLECKARAEDIRHYPTTTVHFKTWLCKSNKSTCWAIQETLMMVDQFDSYHRWACAAEEATRSDSPTAALILSATLELHWGTGEHHFPAHTSKVRATIRACINETSVVCVRHLLEQRSTVHKEHVRSRK